MTLHDLPAFLRKHLDDIATSQGLVDYQIYDGSGSKTGDGFMAEMLAITLDGHRYEESDQKARHTLHLMCKLQPTDEFRRQQFKCDWAFQREVLIYNRVLPLFDQMQRKRGLDETNGFFAYPKCFLASYEPGNESDAVVIMEDLRASGFSLWDQAKVAPFENTKLLLVQLGRLHALSFVLRDQQPEVFAELTSEMYEMFGPLIMSSGFRPIFKSGYARAVKLMEHSPYLAVQDRWMLIYDAAFDTKRYERFAVWTHGDCWINNMMFLIHNGVAEKLSILDWQAGHMRSPVADITHFLLTVTDAATRAKHLDSYLAIYYENVAATIRAFGSDPEKLFSREDLDVQLRENAFYGVINAPLFLPVLVSEPWDTIDMDVMAKSSESGEPEAAFVVLNNRTEAIFRQRLSDVLQDVDSYGWLDMLKNL